METAIRRLLYISLHEVSFFTQSKKQKYESMCLVCLFVFIDPVKRFSSSSSSSSDDDVSVIIVWYILMFSMKGHALCFGCLQVAVWTRKDVFFFEFCLHVSIFIDFNCGKLLRKRWKQPKWSEPKNMTAKLWRFQNDTSGKDKQWNSSNLNPPLSPGGAINIVLIYMD